MTKFLKISTGIGIIIISLSVAYYFVIVLPSKDSTNTEETEPIMKTSFSIEDKRLEQERLLIYREECKKEIEEIFEVFDNLIKNTPDIIPEQARNLGIRAGILDKDGYVIDEDILIKNCIEDKKIIWEK